ncbi:MAG TPA: Fe-S cluster assembly protein SufD [Longimicrobiaceae bacterium]|nr:Fe-S cluster assembly protein SufD [Longimicrobiaceae bacterium]
MTETTTTSEPQTFSRDQVEILSARKAEPAWLREQRLQAHGVFASTPMPDTAPEEWRYTAIKDLLDLDALELAEEKPPVARVSDLPEGLKALIDDIGGAGARLAQVDASVVYRDVPEELSRKGVIFMSLDQAVREHPDLVEKHLGSATNAEAGKFAALNTALWTGGTFLYVPKDVRVEVPLRSFRWIASEGASAFGRTLIVAEPNSEVAVVDELASGDFDSLTLSNGGTEIFAGEGAKVTYVAVQRWGSGVLHLTTDRLIAGRDARITTLNVALGSDVTRTDIQCQLRSPGAHVDMLGLYIAEGEQHIDNQTLQDHQAPHASSNLLFKGALTDKGRSVFRGLIRVHPNAQRTDAYQTNRNLILSDKARADSLPNLEIAADDVRCSHAATVGQLDEEEIFYLQSRGIPKKEAVRLVIFGFFGEVLDQLPLTDVRKELVTAVERKLHTRVQ